MNKGLSLSAFRLFNGTRFCTYFGVRISFSAGVIGVIGELIMMSNFGFRSSSFGGGTLLLSFIIFRKLPAGVILLAGVPVLVVNPLWLYPVRNIDENYEITT